MLMMPMVVMSDMADGAGSFNYYYCDLYFDPNGGTGGPGTVNLRFDVEVGYYTLCDTVPEDVPVREGYVFMGWSEENDGTPDFQPGEYPGWGVAFWNNPEQLIAYAIWEKVSSDYSDLKFLSDPATDGIITYGNPEVAGSDENVST